ncbi:MAG: DEAD/DEAH box helicase, partial [Balneolaceae bacterium]|nr:DEAD/DEAH box helicase [Balneolaceae bacterium]
MTTSKQFNDLPIGKPVLRAVSEMGFEAPTAIQERCIPKILEGSDLVGQAQTGTGKTAAFGIPVVEQIDITNKNVQALIQCPTRELAIQVTGELMKLGKYTGGLNVVPVYGGQPIGRQLKALKRGAHIVVGTPGRTIDHLQRGTLELSHLKQIIFDEADEMLNMGFREDMEKILSYTVGPIQKIMFSATVPRAIRQIMNRYMDSPETVTIERKAITAPNIDQYVVEVRDSVRTEAICRFMDYHDFRLALVFCNTRRKTEKL